MFKNKEVANIFKVEIIIGVIGIIIVIISNLCTYNYYKKTLINNNAYIVNAILEKHPEIENDVIESLTNQDITYSESMDILEKYGLSNLTNLDYINNNKEISNKILIINLIYIVLLIGIMFIIFMIFIKRIYNKINTLSKYTNDILNNRYNMDIREYEEGDISNLKNDLYKMTVKLKEQNDLSLKDKKYLEDTLSDISHQLKTPLTSMYVINELLFEDNIAKSTKKELLSKNKSQLERIEWLVTSLLKMSRLDSGSETLKRKKVKLDDIVDKALEPLRIPLELKNIDLIIDGEKGVISSLDASWTCEALINIIKNAIEHTPNDGKITITLFDNPIFTGIDIKDTGCGITKEDLPHIFERFYKGKGNKESIGIGLNMAKKIIDKQHGDIKVSSEVEIGTIFHIKFYKNVI